MLGGGKRSNRSMRGAIIRPGNALTATSLVRIAPILGNDIDDHEPEADLGGHPASYDVPPTAMVFLAAGTTIISLGLLNGM